MMLTSNRLGLCALAMCWIMMAADASAQAGGLPSGTYRETINGSATGNTVTITADSVHRYSDVTVTNAAGVVIERGRLYPSNFRYERWFPPPSSVQIFLWDGPASDPFRFIYLPGGRLWTKLP